MQTLLIRQYGLLDYQLTWDKMREFTNLRDKSTPDEIWLLQHHPVYTLGYSGKKEHLLNNETKIPIIHSDRGGQITYHGPGQLVVYFLINMRKLNLSLSNLIKNIESIIINLLEEYQIKPITKPKSPGIFIKDEKICSLGLRIRRGCSYHGIALNVDMNLDPFIEINPCGFKNLKMTQLSNYNSNITVNSIIPNLIKHITKQLSYNKVSNIY